jgi:UDP-glucose 4-epimerase
VKILITGGAGFIGSHLSAYLLDKGHSVCCVDNLSTGDIKNISGLFANPRFDFVYGSVLDEPLMDVLISGHDQVYHLAAEVGVKKVVDEPIKTILDNIDGTRAVLDVAYKYKRKVLLTSTSEVYGKRERIPFREEDEFVLGPIGIPRWGYAYSKIIDEFLALSYGEERGLPVVVVRLFNVIGPRQVGEYGMVVPRFVRAALSGAPITVYGSGEQTRCFAYVGDVVRMLADLMDCKSAEGQVFNLGSDSAISINDLARRVKDLTESRSEIVHMSYEEAYGVHFEDIEMRSPCLDKIKKYIDYRIDTELDLIILKVAEYLKGGRL